MGLEFFGVFFVEPFQFLKFHESETKHDKRNFERGLTVPLEVKNSYNYGKNWLKVFQAYFFCGQITKLFYKFS